MMEEPKYEKYWYIDEKTETWCIRDDAPEEAKNEFEEYFKKINDDNIKY